MARLIARLGWAKYALLLVASLSIARAQCTGTTTVTCTGGAGASAAPSGSPLPFTAFSTYPTTFTITGVSGTVTGVTVVLHGLNADGNVGTCLESTSMMLVSPDNRSYEFLHDPGSSSCSGTGNNLTNVTLNISDSNTTAMPTGATNWPTLGGTISVKPGSMTDDQPAKYGGTNFSGPSGAPNTAASAAAPYGSSTMNAAFNGAPANGIWKLYMVDHNSGDNVSFTSWDLTLTVASSGLATTTILSSTLNPSFTSGTNSSLTLTATVSSSSSAPTGTVSFYDSLLGANGTVCSNIPLVTGSNSSTAQCVTSFGTEGNHSLTAVYTPSGSFSTSTSPALNQWVKNHSTLSAGQYCNAGGISIPGSPADPAVYPSVINVGTDTTGIPNSVATVSVILKGFQASLTSNSVQAVLVSPSGQALQFLSAIGSGSSSQPAVNITFADNNPSAPQSTLSAGPYQATSYTTGDVYPQPPAPDPAIPSFFNAQPAGGTGAQNFQQTFNGATANGDWLLYIHDNGGSASNSSIANGWCINITPNTGLPTTTTLTSSLNPARSGQSVQLTATVVSGGTPVSTGSVIFTENGAAVGGGTATPVPVNAGGVATFMTSSLPEGDHPIVATYSGSGFNSSYGTLIQRIDNNPTVSVTAPTYTYCNAGGITIPGSPAPNNSGPATPNPSNIFVVGLPGIISSMDLRLINYQEPDANLIRSLLVGPAATNAASFDFFSGVGNSNPFGPGNLTFSDAASSVVPQSFFSAGSYKPTSYTSNDTFTASPSGFFTLPSGPYRYAIPSGSSTFASLFNGSSGNGTWSLYLNQAGNDTGGSIGQWCLDFTQSLPVLSITKSGPATVTEGDTGQQYTLTVTNNGPGPTGGQVSVTDTASLGLTITGMSGSGWTCTTLPTCTRSDSTAAATSYPPITVAVNVGPVVTTGQTNQATVSGGGAAASATSNTIAISVLRRTTTTAANATAPFSTSAQTVTLSATVTPTDGGSAVNSGIVTFTITQGAIQFGTLATGAVSNGAALGVFTLPAGLVPGTYTINAVYSPGTTFAGSSDSTHTLTVSSPPTTTTAANATAAFSATNQSIPLSAIVTSAGGTVNTGTVTFAVFQSGIQFGLSVTATVVNGSAGTNYVLPGGTPAGTYTIVATYNGTGGFSNSSDSTHTLTILPAATSTAAANVVATYNTASQTIPLSAVVTSAAGAVNVGTVTFTVMQGATTIGLPVTSSTVTAGSAAANFVLPASTPANVYQIRAVYNAAGSFNSSTDTTHTLTVNKATPTITWANPADITFGSALSAVQLNATANVPGTFAYTPGPGTVPPVGNGQTLSVQFVPTDTTDYNAASASVTISVLAAPPNTLLITRTLARDPNTNDLLITLTIASTYGTTLTGVQVNTAKIGTASATVLPLTFLNIPPGGSSSATLRFAAASVGASGSAAVLSYSGVSSVTPFSGSARITLP